MLTFDWMTFRERAEMTFADDAGRSQTIATNERYYAPCEMRWLLQTAGFAAVDIFGCRLGQFSREHRADARRFRDARGGGKRKWTAPLTLAYARMAARSHPYALADRRRASCSSQ